MSNTWASLSLEEQSQLAALYYKAKSRLNDSGVRDMAQEALETRAISIGMNPTNLERQCRHFLYYEKQFLGTGVMIDSGSLPEEKTEKYSIRSKFTPSIISDIKVVDRSTDQEQWLAWLHDRAIKDPYLVVKHPCDEHRPFHDTRAISLDVSLTKHVQPDLIVYGSDCLDFPSISRFDRDPDVKEDFEDILELSEYHIKKSVSERRAVAPNHLGIWLWGNHERRLIHFLAQNAPQVRKSVLRQFRDIIRSAGILWIGEVDSVRLGPLKIEHGVNFGRNAAKATLERGGYQVSKWQGHGHALQFQMFNGEDFSVSSIQSGHLSKYDDNMRTPHYIRGQSMSGLYHQLGTAIADVNLMTRDVSFANLAFIEDADGKLYTRYERKTFASE